MGTRGGVSQISNRHQRANNPYLGDEHYDDSKPTTYLQYLDMNNLYGYAMTQKLPTGFFRFLADDEIKELDISSIPSDSPTGYVLEVSLAYPNHLHEAPERKHIRNGHTLRLCGKNYMEKMKTMNFLLELRWKNLSLLWRTKIITLCIIAIFSYIFNWVWRLSRFTEC